MPTVPWYVFRPLIRDETVRNFTLIIVTLRRLAISQHAATAAVANIRIVVEIKQRPEHKANFAGRVTLLLPMLLVSYQFAQLKRALSTIGLAFRAAVD